MTNPRARPIVPFYYCKLHPDIENVYLETIDVKYKERDMHKAEVLQLLESEK